MSLILQLNLCPYRDVHIFILVTRLSFAVAWKPLVGWRAREGLELTVVFATLDILSPLLTLPSLYSPA